MKKHLFPFPAESAAVNTKEDIDKEPLSQLNIHKSMGPDGKHPRVLVEQFDVIVRSLSVIFKRSWQLGEVPDDWEVCPWRYSKLRGLDWMVSRNPFLHVQFCDSMCLYRSVHMGVCQFSKPLYIVCLIHHLGEKNSTGRQN